jgi:hypothetical protein
MTNSEWLEYLAVKEWQVRKAENGDDLMALHVLADASVALGEAIAGEAVGADRLPALRFLQVAVTQILDGVPPKKALGLWCDHRSKMPGAFARKLSFFLAVGEAYDRLNTVELARTEIARKTKKKGAMIREAWENFGGESGWCDWKKEVQKKG